MQPIQRLEPEEDKRGRFLRPDRQAEDRNNRNKTDKAYKTEIKASGTILSHIDCKGRDYKCLIGEIR